MFSVRIDFIGLTGFKFRNQLTSAKWGMLRMTWPNEHIKQMLY